MTWDELYKYKKKHIKDKNKKRKPKFGMRFKIANFILKGYLRNNLAIILLSSEKAEKSDFRPTVTDKQIKKIKKMVNDLTMI